MDNNEVSVFKSICWCILFVFLSFLIGSILALILYFVINWLMNHVEFVNTLLSHKIVFYVFMTIASIELGRRTSLVIMSLFFKHIDKSRNTGKGFLGAGIILIIYCVIVGIVSLKNGASFLDLSMGTMGLWYVMYGGVSEEGGTTNKKSPTKTTTKLSQIRSSENKGMTERQLEEYSVYIKENCKMVDLPLDETRTFVKNVLNAYEITGKEEAISNFKEFVKMIQKTNPAHWFFNTSFYLGVMNSNDVISEEEMDSLSKNYQAEVIELLESNEKKSDSDTIDDSTSYTDFVWSDIYRKMPEMYMACLKYATPYIRKNDGKLIIEFEDETVKGLCEDDEFDEYFNKACKETLGKYIKYEIASKV